MTRYRTIRAGLGAVALIMTAAPTYAADTAASAQLYDNIDVLGVLECQLKKDVRMVVGAEQPLKCLFTPQGGLPDSDRGFLGSVRALDETTPAPDGNVLSWTVLQLENVENGVASDEMRLTGPYSTACASIAEEYDLKGNALVGIAQRNIVLEPRVLEETSANVSAASAVISFELSK